MQPPSDTQQNKNNALLNALQNVQCQQDAIDKIESLLRDGANIDVVNNDFNTALHISVSRNHEVIVKYLLGRGAKINLKNKDDKTPCDLAEDNFNLNRSLIASVNVPKDGNCLFWATALAYLTPAKNDDNIFRQRAIKLFGEANVDDYMQSLQRLFESYNPFANSDLVNSDTVKSLITEGFRSRVVEHMSSNQSKFSPYLEWMKSPGSWGCEPELEAISEMLQCSIVVKSIALSVIYGDQNTRNASDRIVLFHIDSQTESVPSNPNIENQYEFAVDLTIVDDYIREGITPQSTTADKTIPPFAQKLKFDENLHLSCNAFHDRMDKRLKDMNIDHTQKLTSTPTFPTPKTLAQFAINAYKDNEIVQPDGWELLTTATNNGLTNGYYGGAYWNPKTCQVIIAHRGTPAKKWAHPQNWGPFWTDIFGIVFNIAVSQMHSACTFAEKVCTALKKLGKDHKVHFQLFFTGHSLGGWLAQITAFSAKYLKVKGKLFQKFKNTSQWKGFHAHTVVFDSPGCKDALTQLKTAYDVRYDGRSISLRSLDITSYLSAPNLINTRNEHVGTIYRVFVDVAALKSPEWSLINCVKKLFNISEEISKYTLVTHDKKNILQALDYVDGYGKPKIVTVIDWPVSCLLSSSSEYLDFHQWATNLNKYHPDPEAKEFKEQVSTKSGYFPIRYQTKPFTGEQCSISVFTRYEQQFLQKCQWLQKFPKLLDSAIEEVVDDETTREIVGKYLKIFSIEDEYVKCQNLEDLQECIPNVKHLLFLYRDINDKVDSKLKQPGVEFNRFAYQQPSLHVMSDEFLDVASKFDVCDGIVGNFLSEQEIKKKVMHVIVKHEMRSTSAKLYKNFEKNMSSSSCTVLPLRQLLVIDDRFVRLDNFLKEASKHLLIIECEPNTDSDCLTAARELFLSIVCVLKEKPHKVIVITCQDDKYHEFFQDDYSKNFNDNEYITIEDSGVVWDELAPDSQRRLLSEKVIFFQGEKTSLEEILGCENVQNLSPRFAKMFDAETTLQLIRNQPVTVGSKQLRLRDLGASFVKLYTEILPDSLADFLPRCSDEEIIMIVIDISNPSQDEAAVTQQFLQRLEKDSTKRQTIQSLVNKTIFMYVAKDVQHKCTKWMQLCQTHTNKRIYRIEVTGERISCQQIFDPNLYCKRQFHYKEKIVLGDDIKWVISQSTADDVFIFSGIKDEIELVDKLKLTSPVNNDLLQFAVTEETAESIFDEKSKLDIPCHLLKLDTIGGKEQIIWKRSHGSLKTIRLYAKDNLSSSPPIDEKSFIRQRDDKVVIFTGEPGMGKSTTLTSLAEQIDSGFVIRIDFKDCIHAISQLPSAVSKHSIEDAVKFLAMVDSTGFNSNLAKMLLEYGLEGKMSTPMFLLFDGFDEITETDQRTVASFLKFLQENCSCNIWITTREYPRTILEDNLCVFATSFTRISRQQQQEFLEKFWQITLALQRNQIFYFEEKIAKYADVLLEKAGTVLGQEIYNFMGIPLQMRMLAEVFLPNAQTVSDPYNNDFTAKLHDILGLYRTFIDAKYEIYFRKTGFPPGSAEMSKRWVRQSLNKKHRCLAVELLFPDDVKKLVRSDHSQDAKSDLMELNRVGLIQSTHGDGKYSFIHKSFAEYFVADALASWLKKPQGRHQGFDPLEVFLTRILSRPDFKVIRLFLNGLLSSGKSDSEELPFYEKRIDELWIGQNGLYVDDGLQTAFHVLAEENLQNIFHYLVNIFRKDEDKLSALFSKRNPNQETVLYLAVKAGHSEIVEQILESLKSCTDAFKERVVLASIFRTAEDKENETVKKLQEYVKTDKDMNSICENIKWTLITRFLDAAKEGDFNEMSQIWEETSAFCRYYLIKATDQSKRTALHVASEQEKVQFVQYLIDAGADVNCQDKNEEGLDHFTPLHYAAKFRHKEIVEILLNNKANVNATDRGGFTPLHHSTKGQKASADIVNLLLLNGCDITMKDKTRMTAFAWAAKSGQLDIIKLLIAKGILQKLDINDVDRNGMTALNHAAKAQKWEVAEYLVDQGADVHMVDANGNSPLARVIKAGKRNMIVKMLQPSGKMNAVIDDETYKLLRQNNILNLDLGLQTGIVSGALYSVFCSNNTEYLQMMIDKFNYYTSDIQKQVCICASAVYQQILFNGNVQLSNDMEVAIKSLISK